MYYIFTCLRCEAFSRSRSPTFSSETVIMASSLVLMSSYFSLKELACDSTCEIQVMKKKMSDLGIEIIRVARNNYCWILLLQFHFGWNCQVYGRFALWVDNSYINPYSWPRDETTLWWYKFIWFQCLRWYHKVVPFLSETTGLVYNARRSPVSITQPL